MARLSMPRSLAPVVALLALAAGARAAATLTIDTLDLTPTIASVGVVAAVTGDTNGNATAWVDSRVAGQTSFTRGHAMVRLPGNRFAGSVLFLAAGTSLTVRVVVSDPDAAGPVSRDLAVVTRPEAPARLATRDWWVDAALGNDAAAGSVAAPFRTIQRGANAALPGDVVHVRPGLYREQVGPRLGGTASAPLWFLAEGAGVVIDGSDARFDAPVAWTSAGGALWWTAFADTTTYVAADDARLYSYQALADLQAEDGNVATPGALKGGFFVDAVAKRLYVIVPDHSSPTAHKMHVAIRESAFLVDTVTDVVIQGFEMRYFGHANPYGSTAVDLRDSARCWVRRNDIHHVNIGVRIRRPLASDNVVEDNSIRDTSVWDWPWTSVKGHFEEGTVVDVEDGHGNVVRRNHGEGAFNGIGAGSFDDPSEEVARDTDVYANDLRWHGDDGIEIEGAVRNVRAWANVVRDVARGISIAPVEVGPVFLVRNVLWGYRDMALKVNNATSGWVFLYHTTAVPAPGAAFPAAQALAPSEPFAHVTTRNNIWEANRYVIEYGDTTLLGAIDWDRDDLFTNDVELAGRFVKWLDVRYASLGALAASRTIETNARNVRPQYVDPASGDFTLVAGSPLVDAGQAIPGINDRFTAGAGPDVGAFERGFAPPSDGDRDGDGIPDRVEPAVGTDPGVKDNDVFRSSTLFAMQQYRDFLGREGDAAGVAYWVSLLDTSKSDRARAILSFLNSAEFQASSAPVTRLYFAYFLRIPDTAGLLYWMEQVRLGTKLATVSQAFAGSAEFATRYGSLSDSAFVTLVYRNVLGREPDAPGLAYWTGLLANRKATRGDVMLGFSESAEYRAAMANKVLVTQVYVGMLRRAPDQAGFDSWVAALDRGGSPLDLIRGFLGSTEYYRRFLP